MDNTPRTKADHDDLLCQMYRVQEHLQTHTYLNGQHPATLDPGEQMEYLRTNVLALTGELHEALGETGWKPWATSNHINREAYRGELVDVFHFMLNLMLVADIGPIELFNAFMVKNKRNAERQAEGYDGVSTKCPGCKRAYDDSGVLCTPENFDPTFGVVGPTYCDKTKVYDDLSGYQQRYQTYMMAREQAAVLKKMAVPAELVK